MRTKASTANVRFGTGVAPFHVTVSPGVGLTPPLLSLSLVIVYCDATSSTKRATAGASRFSSESKFILTFLKEVFHFRIDFLFSPPKSLQRVRNIRDSIK